MNQFGSGWSWLVHDGSGLAVVSTANQDNPLTDGKTPLLGVDVWEHSYYLKYQNQRPAYIDAWWNIVGWDKVAERLGAAGLAAGLLCLTCETGSTRAASLDARTWPDGPGSAVVERGRPRLPRHCQGDRDSLAARRGRGYGEHLRTLELLDRLRLTRRVDAAEASPLPADRA